MLKIYLPVQVTAPVSDGGPFTVSLCAAASAAAAHNTLFIVQKISPELAATHFTLSAGTVFRLLAQSLPLCLPLFLRRVTFQAVFFIVSLIRQCHTILLVHLRVGQIEREYQLMIVLRIINLTE